MAPSGLHDLSVRAPEVQRPVVILIAGFGLASFLFCVAAELSRVRTYSLYEVETGQMECIYPKSVSMWYAIAGTVSLILTQTAGFVCGGVAWCSSRHNYTVLSNARTSIAVIVVVQLVFAAAAAATLLTAALKNSALPATPIYLAPNHPTCQLLDEGIFLTAAILSLFSGIMVEAYYIMSLRAKREQWFDAYSAGPVDGLEMLDKAMEVLRVPGSSGSAREQGAESNNDVDDDDLETAFGRREREDTPDHEIWRRDEKFKHIPRP